MRVLRSIFLVAALSATFVVQAHPRAKAVAPAATTQAAQVQRGADLVFDAVGARRVVLLGEMHGTQEAPALVGALLDRYVTHRLPVVLALEIDTQEQSRLDRYVESRGTSADRTELLAGVHWREAHHDGRDSVAMFELVEHVRALHERGVPVELVAFNDGNPDMDTRNRRMADVLRATATRHPTSSLLVLTGNIHAMTRRPPWEMFDGGKRIEPPMTAGRFLADLSPLSINIEGAHGAYVACTQHGQCGVQPVAQTAPDARVSEPRLQRNADDDAWDETLLLPCLTPSPPAIEQPTMPIDVGTRARRT